MDEAVPFLLANMRVLGVFKKWIFELPRLRGSAVHNALSCQFLHELGMQVFRSEFKVLSG